MPESASYLSFCNCKATAREISSPPVVRLTIPFPLRFPFPFTSFVPFPFPVPFSPPCVSSPPSPLSLSLPSPGQFLPPLGAPGSAQFSSSSYSSIISSQFSGLTPRKSPGLYCREIGGSIFTLRSSLPYQEKRSPVRSTFPDQVLVRIGVIDLHSEGMGVVPPPIVHLVVAFVKHLPHI